MYVWVFLVIVAQAFNAISILIDKYIVASKRGIRSASAYTFYSAMLSGSVIFLIPFGVIFIPSSQVLLLSFLSGILYVSSLYALYTALKYLSTTDVAPVLIAFSSISTATLAGLFLAEDLPVSAIPAFLLMVVGALLVYCFCFSWRIFALGIVSGLLLGAATFVLKLVFVFSASYWNAMFWPLLANALVAFFIFVPFKFEDLRTGMTQSATHAKWLVLLSKSLGGVVFALVLFAISLGSVSIVNALSGLQLVFLLLFVWLFQDRLPKAFLGEIFPGRMWLKVVGTIAIVLGLAALFLF